jgi:polysaccharide transporter, PST family
VAGPPETPGIAEMAMRAEGAAAEGTALGACFKDHAVEAGHGRRSLRGGLVSIGSRAVNAVIQVGAVVFLARLLSPEDYGLVSMVAAFTGFAPVLVDLGTRDSVAQRARIKEAEVSALFWITVSLGCGAALAVAACGPWIARFYGEPRLVGITAVSALTFATAGLTGQHYALMRRAMRFEELGTIEMAANVVSAAGAVAMAFCGFQYWALVTRPVTLSGLVAVGVWVRCRWVPPKPQLTTGVKEMLRLGIHSTGFTMADFAGGSSDRVIIGHRGGAAALGYYQNAMFVYENLLSVLVAPLHAVAVSSLSKTRENPRELKRLWSKALAMLGFCAMPIFGILAVTSEDVVTILLGAKWAVAGTLLSVLALRGIPHTVERTLGWLHVTAGRTDRWMRWGILATAAQLGALLCGLPYGPMGIVTAYTLCMFALFIPAIAYAGRPLEIGAGDVIAAVWRPMAGSLIAAAVGFGLRYTVLSSWGDIPRLLVLVAAYALVYALVVVKMLRMSMPIEIARVLVRRMVPGRGPRGRAARAAVGFSGE